MPPKSQVVKRVEMGGVSIWVLSILFLWMRTYEAQTVAQSSSSLKWLSAIACLGTLWGVRRSSRRVKP
jgi:hypothetical protein